MSESLKIVLSLLLCTVMLFGFTATGETAGLYDLLSVRVSADDNNETIVPVTIVNVTETEIELKAVEGYEYSIDNGVSFVSDPVFKGLNKGQTCYVCQRKAADGDAQAGENSDCIEVTTNTAPVYVPNLNKIKSPSFEKKESIIRAGEDIGIIAYSSDRRSDGDYQWGDLAYIPVKYEVYNGTEKESEGEFSLENASVGMYRAIIKPKSVSNDYSVKIFYAKLRYEGPERQYVTIDADTVKILKFTAPSPPPSFLSWIINVTKLLKVLLSFIFQFPVNRFRFTETG